MSGLTEKFDQQITSIGAFINKNVYLNAVITIFMTLYAGVYAPKLPESVGQLFNSNIFKVFVLFLIALMTKAAPHIALISALGFFISLQAYQKYKINQMIVELVQRVKNAVGFKIQNQNQNQNQNLKYSNEKQVPPPAKNNEITPSDNEEHFAPLI